MVVNDQWASALERAVNVNFAVISRGMVTDRRFEDNVRAARIIYVKLLKDKTDETYARVIGNSLEVDIKTVEYEFNDLMDFYEKTPKTKKYYRYRGKVQLIQNYLKHNERIS